MKRAEGYNLTVKIDDLEMSYNDVGNGKITIIFIHGFPFEKSMWDAQLEFFKSSHRVIAYDIRGFSKSEDEKSVLNIQLFADDLIRFMDKLDIDKAVVCGLSMGGYILLNAQKRYPDRFEGLILCDTQCISDSHDVMAKRVKDISKIKADGVYEFNEAFIKSVFHKDSLSEKKDVVDRVHKMVFANSQHEMVSGLIAIAGRSQTCTTLHQIKTPTLIICGREDQITPVEQSEFMHNEIQGSTLAIIEDAGHVSNLEQPDKFNQHILHFLADLIGVGMSNFNV